MKKIVINSLLILLNLASYSYGMSGDEPGYDFFTDIDTWLAPSSQQESTEREKRRREKEEGTEELLPEEYSPEHKKRRTLEPQIPLPPLRILHEQAVPTAPVRPTYLSSIDAPSINRAVPIPEILPSELAVHVMSFLPRKALPKLALVSKTCRDRAHAAIKHLDIFVNDITPEALKLIANRFTEVKSVYIKGTGITPQQIKLLGETFPKLESLNLWSTGMTAEHVKALITPGILNALKHLNVSFNDVGDMGLELLTQASFADNLESLDLASNQLTGNVVRVLAESGAFKSLKALTLAHNSIEIEDQDSQKVPQQNAGIKFLSKTAFTRTLESLDLRATYLDAHDLDVLADSGEFKALKKLDISENYIHPDNLEALARASFAATLESLILERNKYWEDATELVDIIARPNTFKALKVLNLTPNPNNEQAGDSISILARAPFATQLEELHIASTRKAAEIQALANTFKSLKIFNLYSVRDEALEADEDSSSLNGNAIIEILAQAPLARQLEELGLPELGITDQGIRTLTQPKTFTSLKSLNLRDNCRISPVSLQYLIQAPFVDNLESLNLSNTPLTEADISLLAHSGKFKNLKKLYLDMVFIGNRGLGFLAEAPFANTLANLSLEDAHIDDQGLHALALPYSFKSLKNLNLNHNDQITNTGIKTLSQASFAKNKLEVLSVGYTGVEEDQNIDTLHALGSFSALKRFIDFVEQNED